MSTALKGTRYLRQRLASLNAGDTAYRELIRNFRASGPLSGRPPCVFAFLARDTGAATGLAMRACACAWTATALTVRGGVPGSTSAALGIFLMTIAIMMVLLAVAALSSKPLFRVLPLTGCVRFAITGACQRGGPPALEAVAGWIGITLAGLRQLRRAGAAAGSRPAAHGPAAGPVRPGRTSLEGSLAR